MRQSPSNAPMAPEDGTGTFHIENVNLKRLTAADIVTGIASLLLLVSLFLPWYAVTGFGTGRNSVMLNGVTHHKFLWLAVLLSVVVITYLIVHATAGSNATGASKEPVLLGLSVVQLILVVIPFFYIPVAQVSGVTVAPAYGAYIALVGAVVSLIAVIVPFARGIGRAPGRSR